MLKKSSKLITIGTEKGSYRFMAFICLLLLAFSLSVGNMMGLICVVALPLSLIMLITFLNNPSTFFYFIFCLNFFMIAIIRYTNITGLSILMDSCLIFELLLIFIFGALKNTLDFKKGINILTIYTLLWMLYCIGELVNPTGLFEAWYLSRGVIFNGLIISMIASLLFVDFKQVKVLMNIYAFITILAFLKVLMQTYIGFDYAEQKWLDEGGAMTHIIHSGIRYFSFYSDAGNLGSNMGAVGITFGLLSFLEEKTSLKVYYGIISFLGIITMMSTGTRGAMIVPFGGLALYVVLSKNVRAISTGGGLLVVLYIFFAFTYIGEGNAMIRRMRTAFHPNSDPSYLVRVNNRAILSDYLKNKPFGEGLGLSGGENKRVSIRLTTEIPHDSWYVKLWVETGILGITLYLAGLMIVTFKCVLIIMFKLKDTIIRSYMTAMLCGVVGMMASAYGNAFFGQYPTMIIVFTFLAIILNSPQIEENYEKNKTIN